MIIKELFLTKEKRLTLVSFCVLHVSQQASGDRHYSLFIKYIGIKKWTHECQTEASHFKIRSSGSLYDLFLQSCAFKFKLSKIFHRRWYSYILPINSNKLKRIPFIFIHGIESIQWRREKLRQWEDSTVCTLLWPNRVADVNSGLMELYLVFDYLISNSQESSSESPRALLRTRKTFEDTGILHFLFLRILLMGWLV